MMHGYMLHTDREPNLQLRCLTHTQDSTGREYPVLRIGDATIFPTVAQLETLHEVIGKYLERLKQAEPAEKWADPDAPNPWPWTQPNETQEVASGG